MSTGEQTPAPGVPATPQPQRSGWTAGHVIGMVFASIGGIVGLALLVGGLAVIGVYAFGRDDDGYFTTNSERLESGTYAITTEDIDLGAEEADWAPKGVLGDVRLRVDGGRTPVFIGIGPDDAVDRYLAGVAHDQLVDFDGGMPEFLRHTGARTPRPPGEQDFWVAQSAGRGDQALTWDVEFGRWTAVVMNADATRVVDVEADAGFKLDWAIWVGAGLLVFGLVMSAGAAVVIVLIGRHAATHRTTGPATGAPA